jgi:NAD(P)-dependent dehydrogenase (short-subunit alcohol dehydrogenase family)
VRRRAQIAGRTAFVTGAARGIGAATAERLHAAGANVALVGLEEERLEALAARLGGRAAWFPCDVTEPAALEAAVRGTVERFGGIDIGIANAGVHYIGALATAPVEQVERELAVNLLGTWRTDRALLGPLTERRGYLLNIASVSAALHLPLLGAYATAKAGVEALSDCLRAELAGAGTAVGCTYFGFVDTDLTRASFAHPSTAAASDLMPGFMRRPIPLAAAVDAIERGIRRRSARIWAPAYVGPTLLFRGLVQPLNDLSLRGNGKLAAALRLADPGAAAGTKPPDPLLGVAVTASEERGA